MSRWYPTAKRLTARDLEFYAQGMWDLYVGILAGAMCASGAAEDAYRKGFLGGYRKARRDDEAD